MTKASTLSETARVAALAADLRVLAGKLKRRLREQTAAHGLTWAQVSVLGHLEREGPATVTELARVEGVRPQSMGATVSALEQAGLVKGSAHPTDGRQTVMSLTAKAREWIKASRAAREDWLFQTIRSRLSPAEQTKLAAALELIKRLVDE